MSENSSFDENTADGLIKFFDEGKVKTIKELCDDYLLVNAGLIKAMDMLTDLIDVRKRVTIDDVNSLKLLDINYSGYIAKDIINQNGENIQKIILDASLIEAYDRSITFFKSDDINKWSIQLDSYKSALIKITDQIAFNPVIDFINRLENNLYRVFRDFNADYSLNPYKNEFVFLNLLADSDKLKNLNDRKQIFVNAILECEFHCLCYSDLTSDDKYCENFMIRCRKAIDAIDFQIKNTPTEIIQPKQALKIEVKPSTFKIASKKKTDFIKVISAMYDAKIFVGEDGKAAANKQELMEAFGTLLNDDFSKYSSSLAQAKSGAESMYMKTFETLSAKAYNYLNDV